MCESLPWQTDSAPVFASEDCQDPQECQQLCHFQETLDHNPTQSLLDLHFLGSDFQYPIKILNIKY